MYKFFQSLVTVTITTMIIIITTKEVIIIIVVIVVITSLSVAENTSIESIEDGNN